MKMKAFTNTSGNVTFVNLNIADVEKAIASGKANGHNQISIPLFARSGAGTEGLHSLSAIAKTMGKEKLFLTSGDVETREYTPKGGAKVEV